MRAFKNLRSVLIHRLPQAQSATSASTVYRCNHLRAFAAASTNADSDTRSAGYKSWNRLSLALGAAFVTGVVYEEVSRSTRCEQQASSGQTKVVLRLPTTTLLICIIWLLCKPTMLLTEH